MTEKITSTTTLTLLSLEALLSGIPSPDEENFRQLADELEENPPPGLTPKGLSIVLQILRGEGEESKPIL